MNLDDVQWGQILLAALLSFGLSFRSYKRRSLTTNGCLAAFAVGYATASVGIIAFIELFFFFGTCTFITKWYPEVKKKLEADYDPRGHRSAWQVWCNALPAFLVVVLRWLWAAAAPDHASNVNASTFLRPRADPVADPLGRTVLLAVLAHYAACQGDTFSSEIGVSASAPPRLITEPWRVVPRGTNGGITVKGTAAAVLGGVVLAIPCVLSTLLVPVGVPAVEIATCIVVSAIAGTVVDSLLGAALQYSAVTASGAIVSEPRSGARHICGRAVLTNNAVNLLSSLIVTAGVVVWTQRLA